MLVKLLHLGLAQFIQIELRIAGVQYILKAMSVKAGAHLIRHFLVLQRVVAWTIVIVKSEHLVGHMRQIMALAHRNGFVFPLQLFPVPAIDLKIATVWGRQLVDESFLLYAEGRLRLVQ